MSTTTEPLRIGLVSLHTSPGDEPGSGEVGGMNVVVRHQAEALADRGHQVDVITRRSSPTQPDSVSLLPGVCLRFLSAGPAEPVPKGEHDAFIAPFRAELEHLGPYDVLHSHHWFSGAAALPVARERGIPHVQSFHSIAAASDTPLSEGERPESAGREAGERLLARESDAVVVVSGAEADTVRTRLGGDPTRVWIVPPGVDGSVFRPAGAAARRADVPYVVAAARVQPLKGLDLAIEAIAGIGQEARPTLVIGATPRARRATTCPNCVGSPPRSAWPTGSPSSDRSRGPTWRSCSAARQPCSCRRTPRRTAWSRSRARRPGCPSWPPLPGVCAKPWSTVRRGSCSSPATRPCGPPRSSTS